MTVGNGRLHKYHLLCSERQEQPFNGVFVATNQSAGHGAGYVVTGEHAHLVVNETAQKGRDESLSSINVYYRTFEDGIAELDGRTYGI